MDITRYSIGPYDVIKINEALTLSSSIEQIEDIITSLLIKGHKAIAIHFADNSYLSSRSGAILVRCWELIKDHNGSLAFINSNDDIADFLSILDVYKQIRIFDTEDDLAH
jgi:anti-anti-sigma regulatory factor